MKLRLLVMLGLLAAFWVVARQMRKRLFGEPDAVWGPGQEATGETSIPQAVRTEPLQPSPPPAASETAEPAEDEAVTPPHGDPLGREIGEGTEDDAEGAPSEAAAETRPADTGSGSGDGAEPSA